MSRENVRKCEDFEIHIYLYTLTIYFSDENSIMHELIFLSVCDTVLALFREEVFEGLKLWL